MMVVGGTQKAICCINSKCNTMLSLNVVNEKWAGFDTVTLLATKSARFYFPRAWNDGRPWVSWEKLYAMYNEFEKEKSCPIRSVG